jgi:hypothetical protein
VVNAGFADMGAGYHVAAAKDERPPRREEMQCSTNDRLLNLERVWKLNFCPFSTTMVDVVAKAR